MTIRNLEKLLAPRSVAFIGASPEPASVGAIVTANLAAGGFAGPIWLVNPRHSHIGEARCYPTVAALPGVPDLGVIATPPETIPGLIAELAAKGTRAAVVITAGVSAPLRAAMLKAAQPACLRIEGPNCLGVLLPEIGLNASFSHRMPRKGDLAFLSQSGALITALIDWASDRGVGFSHVVSLGDMADIDFGDLLDYLAGDTRSRAILIYMEQLTQAPKFLSAARRAARAKPVIVLKAGRNKSAAKAALSHTGALAGSDAAYNAIFRRAGLLRVKELGELFDAAEILSRAPTLAGERLAIVTNGGGAGVLAADTLADLGGRLAELSSATKAALDRALPPTWSKGNPVDIIGDAGPDRYRAALEAVYADDACDAVLVLNCPTALASSEAAADVVIAAKQGLGAADKHPKPLLTNWLGDGAAAVSRQRFSASAIPTFETPDAAVRGFMQLVHHKRAQDELMRTPPSLPGELHFERERARAIIAAALAGERMVLSEVEAKALLASYGVPVVRTETVAASPAAAEAAAADILRSDSACVIKILSDDISHKSDVGGVRLAIKSPQEAAEAARDMLAKVHAMLPSAVIRGFTVQPMIERAHAHELIVGMSEDATVGPLMMFGAGGTAVEVIADTAYGLPPLDLKLAGQLISETRISRLLAGYRDRPRADLEAVALVLVRVSYLVTDHPEIREIDINPLLADERGCVALDARVRLADAKVEPRRPMAVRPYPVEWEKKSSVAGIGQVLLRPIRPEDEGLYPQFIEHVSADDLRMRFFTARPDLSHRFLARMTQVDYAREMAFIALSEGGELLGIARMIAEPDYVCAEFAVLVRSDLKGMGLGWRLMEQLVAYARAEGLGELHGQVLAANATMLKLCRELGFEIQAPNDDAGVRVVRLRFNRPAG